MSDIIEAVEVVLTGPSEFIAEHCRRLVEDRLVACAQLGPVQSTYRWDGGVESDQESRAALHTVRDHIDEITRRTEEEHPYDVPCVLVLPLQGGSTAYLEWITQSTRAAEQGGLA